MARPCWEPEDTLPCLFLLRSSVFFFFSGLFIYAFRPLKRGLGQTPNNSDSDLRCCRPFHVGMILVWCIETTVRVTTTSRVTTARLLHPLLRSPPVP